MPAPDLSIIKTWARIDGDEFDTILPMMVAGAVALASHETGVDYATAAMPDSVAMWVSAQVKFWIDNPNAANEKTLDPSPFLAGLLDPYRTYNWTPTV